MRLFSKVLQKRLEALEETSCRRHLSYRSGIDFSSSDYLGFSQDEVLKARALSLLSEVPLGTSASRLLRGHLPVLEEVERELAEFSETESATLFSSGYQANIGLLSALLRPGDLVFSDQFNHASIIDGIRLSGAKRIIYPHCHISALRDLLQEHSRSGSLSGGDGEALKVIMTESIFSMDGDLSPLSELADLAEEFSACLIVDEAHATGLWGNFAENRGAGWVQGLRERKRVFATIHTGGKAFGCAGAWVAGSAQLKEYLLNFSRPFIFTTAPLPTMAMYLKAAKDFWKEVGQERARQVLENSKILQTCLTRQTQSAVSPASRIRIPNVSGAIIPVIVGENSRALEISQQLQKAGFDIRAIRPPTVPEGTARLRMTVNWRTSVSDIHRLAEELVSGNEM